MPQTCCEGPQMWAPDLPLVGQCQHCRWSHGRLLRGHSLRGSAMQSPGRSAPCVQVMCGLPAGAHSPDPPRGWCHRRSEFLFIGPAGAAPQRGTGARNCTNKSPCARRLHRAGRAERSSCCVLQNSGGARVSLLSFGAPLRAADLIESHACLCTGCGSTNLVSSHRGPSHSHVCVCPLPRRFIVL